MDKKLDIAFQKDILTLPVKEIKYTKNIEKFLKKSPKFDVIVSSIAEIGLVEPPVVYEKNGEFIVLDGHLRLEALKKLKIEKVQCILSTDDENFSYNKHVNRVACIQEHKMIKKAIEHGASPEKIAKVLNVDIDSILRKKNLLVGICPEVVELLKDKIVSQKVFYYLKKMKEFRQIQVAKLMINNSNFSASFCRYLWLASPEDMLIVAPQRVTTVNSEHFAKLEDELCHLQNEYQIMNEQYGKDIIEIAFVKGYLKLLLKNLKVKEYLQKNYIEIYSQLERLSYLEGID